VRASRQRGVPGEGGWCIEVQEVVACPVGVPVWRLQTIDGSAALRGCLLYCINCLRGITRARVARWQSRRCYSASAAYHGAA